MPDYPRYIPKPETLWKDTPEVQAARHRDGWADFHRACAHGKLFFDHVERDGRQWTAAAFTATRGERCWDYWLVAQAKASGVAEALEAAFNAAGWDIPLARVGLDRLLGRGAVAVESETDEFEELLG
jgi:hypothetical protein